MDMPRAVLRLGFVGSSNPRLDEAQAIAAIGSILSEVGNSLSKYSAEMQDKLFSTEQPLIRLITGLCEGADDNAASALLLNQAKNNGPVELEIAAVIPFSAEEYKKSRPDGYQSRFDELCNLCAWILQLDGIYDKPTQSELTLLSESEREAKVAIADKRRSRAYRAQGAFLLRHSDILICIADPESDGSHGGSLETLREAQRLGIPAIVIVDLEDVSPKFLVVTQDVHFVDVTEAQSLSTENLSEVCEVLTRFVLSGRLTESEKFLGGKASHTDEFLSIYFSHLNESKVSRLWGIFERMLAPQTLAPDRYDSGNYKNYREQAGLLSGYYVNKFRSSFLANYLAVAFASGLAITALLMLALDIGTYVLLLFFALIEFGLVSFTIWNTAAIKDNKLNHRGIDFRYLAERLRTMYFLPLVGSSMPPPVKLTLLKDRALRQSTVEQIFLAIIRSVSPIYWSANSVSSQSNLIEIDVLESLSQIQKYWIEGQSIYQGNSLLRYEAIYKKLEKTISVTSRVLRIVIAVDILVLVLKILEFKPPILETATPILIFLSALLPIFLASVSGLLSQGEFHSLKQRAEHMKVFIDEHRNNIELLISAISKSKEDPESDLGSWLHKSLLELDNIAEEFSHEVTEWSILYTNEVHDP